MFMKKTLLGALCAGIGLLISNTCARADGDWGSCTNGSGMVWTNGDWSGTNCTNEDGGPQGGQIDGSETLIATVALLPTTNAPAHAGGVANLVSDNEGGLATNQCSITTTGLVSGVYTLSIVKKSDGSTVALGDINIGRENDDEEGDGDGQGDEGDNGGQSGEKCADSGSAVSISEVDLPPDLDPMDIAQIILSDASGNAILLGNLVNPTATSVIKFKAKLAVKGSQSGKTQALSTVKRGKRTDRFTMIGSGVAPNSTFEVYVNGQQAGTVKSNRKGNVLVKKLPANLLTVRAVRLVDANGNTVLSTKF
jgi:hypothetical protein